MCQIERNLAKNWAILCRKWSCCSQCKNRLLFSNLALVGKAEGCLYAGHEQWYVILSFVVTVLPCIKQAVPLTLEVGADPSHLYVVPSRSTLDCWSGLLSAFSPQYITWYRVSITAHIVLFYLCRNSGHISHRRDGYLHVRILRPNLDTKEQFWINPISPDRQFLKAVGRYNTSQSKGTYQCVIW